MEKDLDKYDDLLDDENDPDEARARRRFGPPAVAFDKDQLRRAIVTGVLAGISVLLLGFLVYLVIANMAFMGYLPKSVAYRLPFIASTVQKIAAQEKRIEWAKQRNSDRLRVKQLGQFDLEISEEADLEGPEQAPPFLYKFRVIRNEVRGKEYAELWIDNVQILKMHVGLGVISPYARAKQVAHKLYDAASLREDFNELIPVIASGSYRAMLGKREMFQISREDAVGQNATPRRLLYQWVNATRVAMGASAIDEPPAPLGEDFPAPSFLSPAEGSMPSSDISPTLSTIISASEQTTVDAAEAAKKKLRQLALVYEKMDINALPPIFNRMSNKAAEDILLVLSDRLLAKLFVAMPPIKVATYYKEMTRGTLTDGPEKNYRRFIPVWEKIPPEEIISIWKHLSTQECKKILDRMEVKKKSKLLSTMQTNDAALYLQMMKDD